MELNVLGDTGENVDWWFMYKLPNNVKPLAKANKRFKKTSGREYTYLDADSDAVMALSENKLGQKKGALYKTLTQIYGVKPESSDSLGWICYNDEIPGSGSNDGEKGHTKGVLAFDLESDTAFWLLHSWPKFPDVKTGKPAAWNYGQTYLCIALKDVATARSIAQQMYQQQEPQTYESHLPPAIKKNDLLYKLANKVDVNRTDPPGDVVFLSRAGQDFRLLAKNRHWGKDFWIDHIGPHLKTNMDVETWRRGVVPDTEDSDGDHTVTDILYINLSSLNIPYEWHYTKDHSKWGISKTKKWVCIADINRQESQEKRGGGGICFQHKLLWQSLADIEQLKL